MADTFDFTRRMMIGSALGMGAVGATGSMAVAGSQPPVVTDPNSKLIISGMVGELSDGTIPIVGWTLGASSTNDPLSSSAGSPARSKPNELVFLKKVDKTSPLLHEACAAGQTIGPITIRTYKSAGGNTSTFLYLETVFWTCLVSGFTRTPLEDGGMLEMVTVRFTKITDTYTPQQPNGGPGDSVAFTFDYLRNKVVPPKNTR